MRQQERLRVTLLWLLRSPHARCLEAKEAVEELPATVVARSERIIGGGLGLDLFAGKRLGLDETAARWQQQAQPPSQSLLPLLIIFVSGFLARILCLDERVVAVL